MPTEADTAMARAALACLVGGRPAVVLDAPDVVGRIAAALAEAREEGERTGAEAERRACWELAERERAAYEGRKPLAPTRKGRETHAALFAGRAAGAASVRDAIAARGSMSEP